MFLRFVSQSILRSPRRKVMTVAAVAMGTAVATAMLGVMLDIGDRVNRELRSLGANLMVTPKADSLPVEIGGISYRPVSSQDYIPEDQVQKIKSTFWQLNITGFSPSLKASVPLDGRDVPVEGVWFRRSLRGADGLPLWAGLRTINSSWKVDGQWIDDTRRNDAAAGAPLEAPLEAIVGGALARRLGLRPGAALNLFGQRFTVAGIVSAGGDEEDRIFVRLEVLQRLVNRPGQVDAVQVGALTKPEDEFARKDPAKMTPKEYDRWYCTPYISSIAHQIEEALPMAVARPIWRVADNEGKVLGKIRGLMLLITLAALAAAGLTVWSVMATTVLERRGEIAIMQATGAGNGLVAALFSTEVALEGAAGGLIGSWVGLLMAAWVGRAVFHTALETPMILGPVVVGAAVLASVAGAAQPLRRALVREPAVALRGGE
jgi:putative ABC transport system permease protein